MTPLYSKSTEDIHSWKREDEEGVFFLAHFSGGGTGDFCGEGVSDSPHSTVNSKGRTSCVNWICSTQQSPWHSVGANRQVFRGMG